MTTAPPRTQGFRILEPLELLNWRPIEIGASVPLESQTACPACANGLNTLAVLSATPGTAIRVGVCTTCGYAGYMDRPARAWISRYYAEVWTHGAEKDLAVLRKKQQPDNSSSRAVRRALELLADRSRPILEIGSGYGTMLRFIRSYGVANVIGLESSRRRAETAREATGLSVLSGDFESEAVQAELRKHAPFGIIAAFHVLEHTYNPAEIIAAASRLQDAGDLLVIGVPNFSGEPAMSILLFLPHLHSFTREALERLLHRGGYTVIDGGFSDATDITIITRKISNPGSLQSGGGQYRTRAQEKFRRELALSSLAPHAHQRYFWSKKDAALSGIVPHRWHWRIGDRIHGRRNVRSLLIEPLAAGAATSPPPVQLRFRDRLFLCIK